MTLYFGDLIPYADMFLRGLLVSVVVTLVGISVGSLLGILIYVCNQSSSTLLRLTSRSYIEVIRNTPLLLQLYLLYFGLPSVGVSLSALTATLVGLTVNSSAYLAEIFRAGFSTTPVGQREAAAALGLDRRTTFRYVLLVPALRRSLPAFNNQLILVFLFSSIAALISLNELMDQVLNLGVSTGLRVETLIVGGALYYAVSALFTGALRVVDRKAFGW